jgi:hypothetical protein
MPEPDGTYLSPDMLACIELCQNCHKACQETLIYCLQQGGPHAAADHIRLMIDCAEICQSSANFMERGSDLHVYTCSACADVCRRCFEDCRHMAEADNDNRMAACAEMCGRCAESCHQMAHMVHAPA